MFIFDCFEIVFYVENVKILLVVAFLEKCLWYVVTQSRLITQFIVLMSLNHLAFTINLPKEL